MIKERGCSGMTLSIQAGLMGLVVPLMDQANAEGGAGLGVRERDDFSSLHHYDVP